MHIPVRRRAPVFLHPPAHGHLHQPMDENGPGIQLDKGQPVDFLDNPANDDFLEKGRVKASTPWPWPGCRAGRSRCRAP